MMLLSPLPTRHLVLLHDNNLLDCKVGHLIVTGTCCIISIFIVFLLLDLVSSLLHDLATPFHVAYFSTVITLYFPSRLGFSS